MKLFFIYILAGISSVTLLFGQTPNNHTFILDNALLTIKGYTNVSDFQCSSNLKESLLEVCFIEEKPDEFLFNHTELALDIRSFTCQPNALTNDFQEVLNANQFPFIYLFLNKLILNKEAKSAIAYIQITLNGVKKNIVTTVLLNTNKNCHSEQLSKGKGEVSLCMRDFGIEPPVKFMGMVKVEEIIIIEFEISGQLAESKKKGRSNLQALKLNTTH